MSGPLLQRILHASPFGMLRHLPAVLTVSMVISAFSICWGQQEAPKRPAYLPRIAKITFFYAHQPKMSISLEKARASFDLTKEDTQTIKVAVKCDSPYNISVQGDSALKHTANAAHQVPYELKNTATQETLIPRKDTPLTLIKKAQQSTTTHAIDVTVKGREGLAPGSYKGHFTLSIAAAG